MKRLGIFVFYDKDGILDRYVCHLLSTMRVNVAYLITVCNGKLSNEGEQILRALSDELFIRENLGYDAMALKLALTEYLGWEKVSSYDEVIFFNDTFFGPVYPWQEVFDVMDQREIDFWGLTRVAHALDYYSLYEKKIPAHIQSYFYAFRKTVLCHPMFQQYWNTFDSTDWIFSDVTNRHEKVFTRFIEELGFKWDTYVKADFFESTDPKQNFNQYYYIAYELLRDYRCPIIKRKNFIMNHLTDNPGISGNDVAKALDFIDKNTDYDVDLIWENILRLYNMQDIRKTLNLNYIIPYASEKEAADDIVLILWISYPENMAQCLKYIEPLRRDTRIHIYSESEEILNNIQAKLKDRDICYEHIPGSFQYNTALKICLELSAIYRYLVFLHDVDYRESGSFRLQQYSLQDHLWSNLLYGRNNLAGIAALFRRHSRLGILMAPQPIFGTYFSDIQRGKDSYWAFGCRSEALRKIFLLEEKLPEENDFAAEEQAVEWLCSKLQQVGYYTAVAMNPEYAQTVCTRMQSLLERMLQQKSRRHEFSDFDGYLDEEMLEYTERFSKVMVYGAGENGYRAACLLKAHGLEFAGFLVSDGQAHDKEKYGERVFTLSEINDPGMYGIVVAIANPTAQREVEKTLAARNCTDIFFL